MSDLESLLTRASEFGALEQFSEIIELLSDNVLDCHKSAELYCLRGRAERLLNASEKAVTYLTMAIQIDKNHAKAYVNRGCAWYNLDQYEDAIEDFSNAIGLGLVNADVYLVRGHAFRGIDDMDHAVEDFTRVIELGSADADLYYHRGLSFAALNEHAKSIQDLNKVIEFGHARPEVYFHRGMMLYFLADYEPAMDDLTKAIVLAPNNAIAYAFRGMAGNKTARYDKSLQDLTRAIELGINSTLVYRERGVSLARQKEHHKAIKDFTRAIELDPADADAYGHRGIAWHDIKEYDKAIQDYSKALTLDPGNATLYFNRGLAWLSIEEYIESIKDLSEVISLDPVYPGAYRERGDAWYKMEEYAKAIQDCTEEIRLNTKDARAYFIRGKVWGDKKEWDKSINDLTKAIEIAPDFYEAYIERASCWTEKKEFDMAIEDNTKAIGLDRHKYFGFVNRGAAWFRKTAYDKAVEDFTEAIELGAQLPVVYVNRASALFNKDDDEKAYKDVTRALDLYPDFADAYFLLGKIYQKGQDYNLSLAYYKRAFYLNYTYVKDLTDTLKNNFFTPYILKSVLCELGSLDELKAFGNDFAETMRICETWDSYLTYLKMQDLNASFSQKLYAIEGMVNYHMGNSIEAYKIFRTAYKIDGFPCVQTLRDQYYVVLSALDFLQPVEDILPFILKQVQADGDNNDLNRYYAGQIHLLINDAENALKYFDRCTDFLPALYAKIAVYKKQKNFSAMIVTSSTIEELERKDNCPYSFFEGIQPVSLHKELSLETVFDKIDDRVIYYQLLEEIKEVRAVLRKDGPYRHIEFHELLQFDSFFKEEMEFAPRLKELKEFENYLAAELQKEAFKIAADSIVSEISNNTEAHDLFDRIRQVIEDNRLIKTPEEVLALRIHKPVIEFYWYHKFVLYFFLKGAYDEKTALRLYLYVIKIRLLGSNYASLSTAEKNIALSGADILITAINKLSIGLIYKALALALQVLHLQVERQAPPKDQSTDYRTFKEHYYENLGFFQQDVFLHLTKGA